MKKMYLEPDFKMEKVVVESELLAGTTVEGGKEETENPGDFSKKGFDFDEE